MIVCDSEDLGEWDHLRKELFYILKEKYAMSLNEMRLKEEWA